MGASEADKHANPHYTIVVNVKFTEGGGMARNTKDTLSVTTTDVDKHAAIRRAIALLNVELESEPDTGYALPKPWPRTDMETR